jgi:HlyD family secretion protein
VGLDKNSRLWLWGKKNVHWAVSEVNVAAQEKYVIAPQDMSVETINLKVVNWRWRAIRLSMVSSIDRPILDLHCPKIKWENFKRRGC